MGGIHGCLLTWRALQMRRALSANCRRLNRVRACSRVLSPISNLPFTLQLHCRYSEALTCNSLGGFSVKCESEWGSNTELQTASVPAVPLPPAGV